MKKKEFSSKLQFHKTTVVSFNKMTNIIGGTLQNEDTRIVSVDGYTCILTNECNPETVNRCVPTTAMDNTCPPPTTRAGITDHCGEAGNGSTK